MIRRLEKEIEVGDFVCDKHGIIHKVLKNNGYGYIELISPTLLSFWNKTCDYYPVEIFEEVKRVAKVGEYVKVINDNGEHFLDIKIGEIVLVEHVDNRFTRLKNGWIMEDDEYVVLEGYYEVKNKCNDSENNNICEYKNYKIGDYIEIVDDVEDDFNCKHGFEIGSRHKICGIEKEDEFCVKVKKNDGTYEFLRDSEFKLIDNTYDSYNDNLIAIEMLKNVTDIIHGIEIDDVNLIVNSIENIKINTKELETVVNKFIKNNAY